MTLDNFSPKLAKKGYSRGACKNELRRWDPQVKVTFEFLYEAILRLILKIIHSKVIMYRTHLRKYPI